MSKLKIPDEIKVLHTPNFLLYKLNERFDVNWKETGGRSNNEKLHIILDVNGLLHLIEVLEFDEDYHFGNPMVSWKCLTHNKIEHNNIDLLLSKACSFEFCTECTIEKKILPFLENIRKSSETLSFPFLDQELKSVTEKAWRNHDCYFTVDCVLHGRFQIREEYFNTLDCCSKCRQEKLIEDEREKQRKEGKRFSYNYENEELTDDEICSILTRAGVDGEIYDIKPVVSYFTDASYSIALINKMSINCYHITFTGDEVLVSRNYKSDSKFWHLKKEKEFAQKCLDNIKPNAFKVIEVDRANNYVKAQCNVCGREYSYHYHYWVNKIDCLHSDSNRSFGEQTVYDFLTTANVEFSEQKTFQELGALRFDFFIPKLRTLIEVNGGQHYSKIDYFHKTDNDFLKQQERDNRKRKFCNEHGYKLIELDLRVLTTKEDLENELNYRLLLENSETE